MITEAQPQFLVAKSNTFLSGKFLTGLTYSSKNMTQALASLNKPKIVHNAIYFLPTLSLAPQVQWPQVAIGDDNSVITLKKISSVTEGKGATEIVILSGSSLFSSKAVAGEIGSEHCFRFSVGTKGRSSESNLGQIKQQEMPHVVGNETEISRYVHDVLVFPKAHQTDNLPGPDDLIRVGETIRYLDSEAEDTKECSIVYYELREELLNTRMENTIPCCTARRRGGFRRGIFRN